jgi:hypothetical protein
MEVLNHVKNCKILLIKEILTTNNNVIFFPIYDNSDLLIKHILYFKNEDFYRLLALFNHNNYIGYFSQKEKHNLVKIINIKEDINKFLEEWLEKEYPNREVLKIEICSLNLLLEKMIIKGDKENILENLEEIKFNLFTSTENLRNKFYNFKTKIIGRDNIERDVYKTLNSIINGDHNLLIKDLVYIKNYYQDELELLTYKI